ncbi:MAG TPA: hypothetical protein VFP61_00875 [Acidimicrobiales bacterium]|nr:hypothetical protein [Acidimicrobiales bacterium]
MVDDVIAPPRRVPFGPLTVSFDRRVLEPRPWTLLQSEWAAELAGALPAGPLCELCAGAGHIGQAAAVLSGRSVVQVEADPVAAGYATANAIDAGVDADVRALPLEAALRPGERFWVMLADPPYLPTAEVGDWPDDPVTAIDGGADGLAVTRAALAVVDAHLAPGGAALLQVAGAAQAAQVAGELRRHAGDLVVGEVRAVDHRRAVVALHHKAPA